MMQPTLRTRRIPVLAAAAAVVAAAMTSGRVAGDEPFQLVYDLRVHGTGEKTATVSVPGDEIVMDLFAILYGTNGDARDEQMQSGSGGFSSSTGGLLGDLWGLPSPSPFNSLGSGGGASTDLDGDGDLDVGSFDPSKAREFYSFRAGAPVTDMPAGGFHIGQLSFTATSLGEGQSTEVSFEPREGREESALFWVDGEILNGMTGRIGFGAPVTISYLPPVGGEVDFLSGTIDEHVTISRPSKPAQGTTLLIARGLDVVGGGSLDTRDAGGSHGAHEIRIEDATSGNSGGSINAGLLYVGRSGSGTFTQSGGTTRIATHLSVGHEAGGIGTLIVSGGNVSGGPLSVGHDGTGTLGHSGGTVSVSRVELGVGTQGTGTVEVHGGASMAANGATVGVAGQGTLRLRGGSLAVNGELTLGAQAGGRGELSIEGGTLNAGLTFVGKQGSGRVTQTGGSALVSLLYLNSQSASSSSSAPASSYTLNGGTLVTGSTRVGDQLGAGVFAQDGGTFESGVYLQVLNPNAGAGSRFELNGGTLRADGLLVGTQGSLAGGEFVQTGGESEFQTVGVHPGGRLRYAGGSMAVSKNLRVYGEFDFADAPVTLRAANGTLLDFSNATLRNTGNASIVAGSGSLLQFPAGFDAETAFAEIDTDGLVHFAGERLVISASHTIGGTGTIEGDVNNAGVVSPGNSPGMLEINGSYTQTETGALHIEIGGTDAESFDLLSVAEGAELDGRLTVALLDGFVPSAEDRFTVLLAEGLAGAFDNAAETVSFGQGTFDVIYDGDSVTLANFVAVPEPTGAMLLLVASPLLLGRRRRR